MLMKSGAKGKLLSSAMQWTPIKRCYLCWVYSCHHKRGMSLPKWQKPDQCLLPYVRTKHSVIARIALYITFHMWTCSLLLWCCLLLLVMFTYLHLLDLVVVDNMAFVTVLVVFFTRLFHTSTAAQVAVVRNFGSLHTVTTMFMALNLWVASPLCRLHLVSGVLWRYPSFVCLGSVCGHFTKRHRMENYLTPNRRIAQVFIQGEHEDQLLVRMFAHARLEQLQDRGKEIECQPLLRAGQLLNCKPLPKSIVIQGVVW